jgi:homoserine O-acetyltransferase
MSRHDIATLHPSVSPASLGCSEIALISSLDGAPARVSMRHALIGSASQPCLVVLGGISASRQADAWWPDQVGPGRALDTRRFCVLGIDYLSALPDGWRGITPHDQAAALAAVLDDLGITRVHALVGASYGGAVALAFAERYPQRLDAALVLSMADRPSPMASALRALQRELLQFGSAHGCEAQAVAWARALAVTTYRSEAEFARRFDGDAQFVDGRWQLPVEGYLRAQGQRFAERFDAQSYRVLSESLDLHRVDPAALHTPLYLLAVAQDRLVPQADVEALAAATGGAFASIASEFGHDAFLKEPEAVGRWLRASLGDLERMRRPSMTA